MKTLMPYALLVCALAWVAVSIYRTEAKASSPVQRPQPAVVEDFGGRIEMLALAIAQLRSQARQDTDDVAALAVIGAGVKRRYTGGVECDGSLYLPNEPGARASRALRSSGMCETPGLLADLGQR